MRLCQGYRRLIQWVRLYFRKKIPDVLWEFHLSAADSGDRATLAIANATRHPGFALVIIVLNFTKAEILLTLMVYALVSAIAFALYHNRYKHTLTSAA